MRHTTNSGGMRRRRPPVFSCLLLALLPLAGGCVFYDDLAEEHDLYVSTRAVLLAHAPAFRDVSVPLGRIPPGQAHWWTRPSEVRALLSTLAFEPIPDPPEERKEVFALVFLPEDAEDRITFFLDANLNLLPGFLRHGEMYGNKFYRSSDAFKILLLRRIESCPVTRAYLPVLGRERPRDGDG